METHLGGLTAGPPHILSAHQLATAWLDGEWDGYRWREQETEWAAPDGSLLYRSALIDLDYKMAYLFQATSPDGRSVDHLALFVRHGRHPEKGWDLDVDWHQRLLGGSFTAWASEAHHWFVDWTFNRA